MHDRHTPRARAGTFLVALLACCLPLAACGGGGGSGPSGPIATPLDPGTLAPKTNPTSEELAYFLERTHWHVDPATLAQLETDGLQTFVTNMLNFPPIGSTPWEQTADLELLNSGDPVGQEGLFPSDDDLKRWWMYMFMHNPNTFQEVLGYFWHDHFATSTEVLDSGSRHFMKDHVNLLRAGNGDLRQMLLDMSRDPAMLVWLDGISNTDSQPNENYAREFWELFTLGVDNGYTQNDIVEGSRAFTGYRRITVDGNTGLRGIVFETGRHDDQDKTVFGQIIPGQDVTDDYDAMVDLTLQFRNVDQWIARAMLSYFAYPNPPQSIVNELAAVLRNSNWDLGVTLQTLLTSEAMFSPLARAGIIKGPLEYSIGFMHATELRPIDGGTLTTDVDDIADALEDMQHIPTAPPNVNGWPGGNLWLSSAGMVERINFVEDVITDRNDQGNAGIDPANLLPPGLATSDEVVTVLADRLGLTLSPQDRADYIQYLDTERQSDGTDIPDPFDPANPTHIDERVRGLLYIMAQHPSYIVR